MRRLVALWLAACIAFFPLESNALLKGQGIAQGVAAAGVPYTLAQSAIPFILPSSGSMGNNGAVSGLTALPTTYSGGAWMYFAASQIVSGSAAGWYWFVGSSTTAGTVFNSTYTSGPVTAGTATAFVTTGPGAFTGEIAEHGGPSITIPAGAMGPNGSLEVWIHSAGTNNANSKQWFPYFNGIAGTVLSGANIASNLNEMALVRTSNRGSAAAQITNPVGAGSGMGATSGTAVFTSVNTAVSNTYDISLKHAGAATDNMILEAFRISVIYAP